jgi:hypothetical protein
MINTKIMIGVLSLLVMVAIVAATSDDNGYDKLEYGRRFRTKKRIYEKERILLALLLLLLQLILPRM